MNYLIQFGCLIGGFGIGVIATALYYQNRQPISQEGQKQEKQIQQRVYRRRGRPRSMK